MKKFFCVILSLISLTCIGGCSEQATEMPDIVFICRTNHYYEDNGNAEYGKYLVTFWDKNGDYYMTDYNSLCELPFDKLTEKFVAGDEHFIELQQKCDVKELEENHRVICGLADNNDYGLKYPEVLPDVMDDRKGWYGLYYNAEGELCSVVIHSYECMTHIYANDERANNVYEWYMESIKIK